MTEDDFFVAIQAILMRAREELDWSIEQCVEKAQDAIEEFEEEANIAEGTSEDDEEGSEETKNGSPGKT